MNVLIIPEDFRKDQYMLKPIFSRLLADLGRPTARVVVCNPPLLGGVSEATNSARLREVVNLYPMVDIFILCIDRDGRTGRRSRLDEIEKEFSGKSVFLAENAWEEIETWVLAGLQLPADWSWSNLRADISVKENYFEPMAELLGVSDGPGGGRKAMGDMASRRLDAIMLKCPEDFGDLAKRLEAVV